MNDCIICRRHAEPKVHTGAALAELGGLRLVHFAIENGRPATRGHLLIEPLRHFNDLTEMNDAESAALGLLIRLGTRFIKEDLGAEHVYLMRINDQVPHVHFHLVPRYPATPPEYWGTRIMEYPGAPKIGLAEVRALSRPML